MKMIVRIVVAALIASLCFAGNGFAKFSCKTESVDLDAGTLVLKECEKKGLKKIKQGNTVSIIKKKKKLEGC